MQHLINVSANNGRFGISDTSGARPTDSWAGHQADQCIYLDYSYNTSAAERNTYGTSYSTRATSTIRYAERAADNHSHDDASSTGVHPSSV